MKKKMIKIEGTAKQLNALSKALGMSDLLPAEDFTKEEIRFCKRISNKLLKTAAGK